jgi:hypothetical protein
MAPITIASYADLVAAVRKRLDQLNLSHETLDALTLLPDGYTSKLLSERPMKHLGPLSWVIFETLGMTVMLVENSSSLARSRRSHAWQQRKLKPWWRGDRTRPSAAERNGHAAAKVKAA